MEGQHVAKLPPAGNRDPKWDKAATDTKAAPNTPFKVGERVSTSTYKNLKMRRTAPFLTEDGHIEVNMRNSAKGEDGRRYGDVYFTWIPTKKD